MWRRCRSTRLTTSLGWDMPDRASWEQAARTLTCTLVRPGFASWTGPSDVALPAPTTTAPANVGQEVLDIDTLAVGQCLHRPDALPGQTDEERPLFISRCDSPHHEEVFHVFELDVAGTPYPGDDAVTTRADQGCFDAFGPYVGVPYDESAPLLLVLLAQPGGVGLREPARAVRAAQRGSR